MWISVLMRRRVEDGTDDLLEVDWLRAESHLLKMPPYPRTPWEDSDSDRRDGHLGVEAW
jgi:hypothetical protein